MNRLIVSDQSVFTTTEFMMKRLPGILLLLSLLIGGLAVWQSLDPERFGIAIEKEDNLASVDTVSLGDQTFQNPHLVESRAEMKSFRPFAFDFESQTVDGKSLQKRDFVGRVLIVDIWATWCPPCRREIPSFVELQSKYEEAGLSIVGMNFERTATPREAILAIDEFRRVQPINYALVLGEDSVTKQVPKFSGYPTTLFIDGTGTVRMTLVGAHSTETLEAYALVLLAELDSPTPVPDNAKIKRPLPVAIKPGIGFKSTGSGSAPQANPYATAAGI